jgi:ComF family protein
MRILILLLSFFNMIKKIKYTWEAFIELFYPRICVACTKHLTEQEEILCLKCDLQLPVSGYLDFKENPIEKLFWGRVKVKAAAALYFFTKEGGIQHLMHHLKYKQRKDIGIWMGKKLGKAIKESTRFSNIDYVVPIPLHPKKKFRRGYNQSDLIAQGIEDETHWINASVLERIDDTATQTKKNKYERWLNVGESFRISPRYNIENKNILLIDDVITTGATMEGNIHALLKAGAANVSVLTVACA